MVKTLSLVKIFLKEIYLNRQNKNNKRSYSFLIVLLALFIFYISFYTKSYIVSLNKLMSNGYNINELILYPISSIILSSIFFSLYSGSKLTFNSKDIAVLSTLPIKKEKIVTAKFIVTYISCTLFSILIYLSFLIGLIVTKNITFVIFISLTLITVFSPTLPLIIVSTISALIHSKLKKISETKAYKAITKVLSLIIVGLFVIVLSLSSGLLENIDGESFKFYYKLLTFYPFGYLIRLSFENNNVFYSLIFFIIYIFIISIFIIIYSKVTSRFQTKEIRIKLSKKERKYKYKECKILNNLMKKDIKGVLDGSQVFLQTFLFPFLIILSAIILSFINLNPTFNFSESIELNTYIFLPIVISIFGICLNNSTTLSMTEENNKIWILRSLPIKEKYIFLSKIILNTLYNFIPSLILIMVMNIKYKVIFSVTVLEILLSLLMSIFINQIYLLIAIKYPNFSGSKSQKLSKGSLLSRLLSVIFASLLISLFIVITLSYSDILSSLILINISLLFLSIILYALIMSVGIKYYRGNFQ